MGNPGTGFGDERQHEETEYQDRDGQTWKPKKRRRNMRFHDGTIDLNSSLNNHKRPIAGLIQISEGPRRLHRRAGLALSPYARACGESCVMS